MSAAERALGPLLAANNARIGRRALDRDQTNPRPLAGVEWNRRLEAGQPAIRAEWEAFCGRGGQLPRIEDVVAEDQGNDGTWRMGLLVHQGRPVALAPRFPQTIALLQQVPGLWSALFSVLEPGAELPEHVGPNAGVLRYHLGIACPPDTALRVAGTTTPYRDGHGILFDDTAPHAAWNRSDRPRTTLFCEVLRPLPTAERIANRAVQAILAQDHRYKDAPARAEGWDAALNGAPPSR